jgi:crossover junction endodeoxyribonuclease RuvC
MPRRCILAIDPGFDRVGLAVMEKDGSREKLLFSECIRTKSKDAHSLRLLDIGLRVKEVISEWQPVSLAIEKLFFNTNTTSAIGVAEARGVIVYEAVSAGLEIFEYGPQAIKIAVTGYGKADKTQIETMVKKLLKLEPRETKRLDDELDAIAVGITHLASQKAI